MPDSRDFKTEIDALRAIERSGSIELAVQVALVGLLSIIGWALAGYWQLPVWFVCTYTLVLIEKWLHARPHQPYSRRLFLIYMGLSLSIGAMAMVLPVFLWLQETALTRFAALVYLSGAMLNTFVVRAKAWPALLSYVIPNAAAMFVVAALVWRDNGLIWDGVMALMLATGIAIYLFVMVAESVRRMRLLRRTTEELLMSQKTETVGNLAGGIAHDFNNLLAVVSANLERLRATESDADRQNMIRQAQDAIDRGALLTRQLLAVGRQSSFKIEPVDVAEVLEAFESMISRLMPEFIQVRVTRDPALQVVDTDRGILESTLLNLALNARDAMPSGGRLNVTARIRDVPRAGLGVARGRLAPGCYAEFAVEDTGRGIPAEMFGQVLEPFFTTRPAGQGSGLGLAMVDGYTRQAGGGVDLRSEVGKGTTIRFFLPLRRRTDRPAQPQGAAGPDPAPQFGAQGLRALLVEDEPALRAVLDGHLRRSGFEVLACETGDTAMATVLQGFAPDVVITDVVMPGDTQGPDLIRWLQARHPGAVYLLMTGYAFSQNVLSEGGTAPPS